MADRGTVQATSADPADLHTRGQLVVIKLAAAGRRLGGSIGARVGNTELAANVPVLVLCELALRGPLRPRDLLEATQLTSGGMTKQLDHLEALGLIERSFGTLKRDRRGSVVCLTPTGAQAAITIAQAVEDDVEALRATIAEVSALLRG